MRGELESVCQTVTANKREAQIESTNNNQKKAPVRWYVWNIYKLLVYSNKAWAVFIPRDGRVPRPLQAEHVWRARHSGEAAADNLASREAAQQTATVTGAQTAECE